MCTGLSRKVPTERTGRHRRLEVGNRRTIADHSVQYNAIILWL